MITREPMLFWLLVSAIAAAAPMVFSGLDCEPEFESDPFVPSTKMDAVSKLSLTLAWPKEKCDRNRIAARPQSADEYLRGVRRRVRRMIRTDLPKTVGPGSTLVFGQRGTAERRIHTMRVRLSMVQSRHAPGRAKRRQIPPGTD